MHIAKYMHAYMLIGKTMYTCTIITEAFEFMISRGVRHRLEYVTVSAKTVHVSMQILAYIFQTLKSNDS